MADRAAAGIIISTGMPLYHEDLARQLRVHYADLLDSLHRPEETVNGDDLDPEEMEQA